MTACVDVAEACTLTVDFDAGWEGSPAEVTEGEGCDGAAEGAAKAEEEAAKEGDNGAFGCLSPQIPM